MPRRASDPERVLQRLDWTVVRRLDGLLQGNYRTLFRGFGLEMAELREYQLTDDVRAIDWNVTARMQTPWVRLFMEDRDITAWFLLDLSPSGWTSGSSPRAEAGPPRGFHRGHGAPAHPSRQPGGRPPLHRRGAARHPRHRPGACTSWRLIHQPARTTRASPRAPRTDLSALLASAHADDPPAVPGLPRLRFPQRARVGPAACHGGAPPRDACRCGSSTRGRGSCPDLGPLVLEDAETGEQLFVDTHDRRFRNRFAEPSGSAARSCTPCLPAPESTCWPFRRTGTSLATSFGSPRPAPQRRSLPVRSGRPAGGACGRRQTWRRPMTFAVAFPAVARCSSSRCSVLATSGRSGGAEGTPRDMRA